MSGIAKLSDKFHLIVANSRDAGDYVEGPIPFVTSAETNNGVVRYVTPLEGDKLFHGPCVVISGLGFASLQTGEILPKGNGGDSCTVVYSKTKMTVADYLSFAAVFNVLHKWRFSYGRKCKLSRLENLVLPWPLPKFNRAWSGELGLFETLVESFGKTLNQRELADLTERVIVFDETPKRPEEEGELFQSS
jgi:hypothetical protein